MFLNAGDIEFKVVKDLKLEESLYLENHEGVDVRKRRRPRVSKLSRNPHNEAAVVSNEALVDNAKPLENEEAVIEQIMTRQKRAKPESDVSAQEEGTMETQIWDSRAPMGMMAPTTL